MAPATTTTDYGSLPVNSDTFTTADKPSNWRKFSTFILFIFLVPALTYFFVLLPLSNIKEVPTLKKTGYLNIQLIPSNTTTFKDDDSISKSEKYLTLKEWKSLHSADTEKKERIVLIGDVHGSLPQLKNLLDKVSFNIEKDQVVFLGDLVSKGPNNIDTLNFAIANNFKGVLGNHELSILSKYRNNGEISFDDKDSYKLPSKKIRFDDESLIAKKLNSTHIDFLSSLPFVMDLGLVPHLSEDNEFLDALHGIADHMGVASPKHKPKDITIDDCLDIEKEWYKTYNDEMESYQSPTIVFYGHHAGKGLNIREYTKGLDSGCVYGDQLTAIVIWTETIKSKKSNDLIVYKSELVQVQCS